jgi:hypothetical protein
MKVSSDLTPCVLGTHSHFITTLRVKSCRLQNGLTMVGENTVLDARTRIVVERSIMDGTTAREQRVHSGIFIISIIL